MIELDFEKKLLTAEGETVLSIKKRIQEREFISLFGKSGAGKTTILRIIAGLTEPDRGVIKVGDEIWYSSKKKINLPPKKRRVGFVFQNYAVFPNMSVRENLEFALKDKRYKKIVDTLLDIVDLKKLEDRKPDMLSGGQLQRVALARALVRKPRILLLDEPLSALDMQMRQKLQDELAAIHRGFDITTLLVSHDLAEIYKLSNRVFVLDNGNIIKSGEPEEVFTKSGMSGKFKFIGEIARTEKNDMVYVLTVLIGNNATKIVATEEEVRHLKIGDKVVVVSKAFNPIIEKL